EVAVQDRRRARAAVVVAVQVAAGPERPAGPGVDAGRAVGAEVDVDPALLDRGRRRGVAVERVAEGRLLDVEDLAVVDNLAAAAVDADGEQLGAVGPRGRQ